MCDKKDCYNGVKFTVRWTLIWFGHRFIMQNIEEADCICVYVISLGNSCMLGNIINSPVAITQCDCS